jgi:hypothetical protein
MKNGVRLNTASELKCSCQQGVLSQRNLRAAPLATVKPREIVKANREEEKYVLCKDAVNC